MAQFRGRNEGRPVKGTVLPRVGRATYGILGSLAHSQVRQAATVSALDDTRTTLFPAMPQAVLTGPKSRRWHQLYPELPIPGCSAHMCVSMSGSAGLEIHISAHIPLSSGDRWNMFLPEQESDFCCWRKASRSLGNSECVQVASVRRGHVMVRDSRNLGGPVLACAPAQWRSFLEKVKSQAT